MSTKFENAMRKTILDLSKNGGRFEFSFDNGRVSRTMTFKPGFSYAKVDELIAMMAESARREIEQQ